MRAGCRDLPPLTDLTMTLQRPKSPEEAKQMMTPRSGRARTLAAQEEHSEGAAILPHTGMALW